MNARNITRLLCAASTLALCLGGTAMAQDADAAVDAVVVTGSRLAAGFAAPTPVTSVGAVALEQRAATQVLESLYDVPAFKQDSGPNQGLRTGSGLQVATANLRGLGATRTLTLVNGLRQSVGSYDTNRIPVGLVDRVEVVTGGASAAYGSDAVAGVVNFILNDRLDGLRATAQYGVAEEGDGKTYQLNFAYGRAFASDKGRVILGADYSDAKGVGNLYSRSWGREEPGLLTPTAAQRAARGLPAQFLSNGVEYATFNTGGIVQSGPLAGTAFGANGAPYQLGFGTLYGTLQQGVTSNYGQTPLGSFYLSQPLKRATSMIRSTYEVTPNLTLFGDVGYTWTHSEGASGVIQYPNAIVSTVNILNTNPFIPAATRAAMAAAGVTSIPLGILPLNAYNGTSGYKTDNDSYTTQINVGARGKVLENWDWDVAFSHGIVRADVNFLNAPHSPNFAAATYVVAGPNGQPICGPLATNPNLNATTRLLVEPGCVPYNPFGVGSASAEAQKYVSVQTHSLNISRQDTLSANLRGTPFSTWAGPVSVAVGGEFRNEAYSQKHEGYDSRAFAFGGQVSYAGDRDVYEGYVEAGVPLLKDVAFAKSVDFNAAVRRTHYEFSGAVSTYKVGATWDVNDAIRFRATQSRDIRAPGLTELFSVGAQTSGGNNVRNPFNGVAGSILARPSGNIALKPEIAQTFTGGMVFQPKWEWAQGFRASADYYWIKLKGVIASATATDTINRCFAGVQAYCANVAFDSSPYGIAYVTTTTYNLNQLRTSGVDIELDYRVPEDMVPVPGRFAVRALGSYQKHLTTIDSSGIAVDRAGTGQGVPTWRWVVNFDYKLNAFSGQLQANYSDSLLADPTLIGPDDSRYAATVTTASNTINRNKFPAMVYWNAQAQYDLAERGGYNLQVFANVNNLLDKKPPTFAVATFTGVGGQYMPYDLIGRAFRFGVRIRG